MTAIKPLVGMTVSSPIGEMTQYGPKIVSGQIIGVSDVTEQFDVSYESGEMKRYGFEDFGRKASFHPTGEFPHYEWNQPYYNECERITASDIPTPVLAMYALASDASESSKISANGKNGAKKYYQSLLADSATHTQLRWEAAEVLVQRGMGLDYLSW